jgi:hypothetical protein
MYKIFLFSLLFISSCASVKPLPNVPKHRTPSKTAKVFYPLNNWSINSANDLKNVQKQLNATILKDEEITILDLNGGIIDGEKQKGDGSQNESQEPLFRANIPFVIKNGFIRNNKNAATFAAKNSGIEKVTFLNIGEDAVATSRKAINFSVSDCEFLNSKNGDKSVQLNQAENAVVEKNLVYGGITGVRVHESSWADSNTTAFCGDNSFIGVDTAWNVSKGVLIVEKKNSYKNVRLPFKVNQNAKITNPDGKVENNE